MLEEAKKNKNSDKIEYQLLSMNDLDRLSVIESKINVNRIIYEGIFSSIEIYDRFIEVIRNNFGIYPEFSYLCMIKEKETDKKYRYITEFINSDKIPKEKLLYDNKIKILYKNIS